MTELLLTPKQISAWKRRAPLPHALDSTAQLVDATLHDDPQRASLLAIRNAYCAAFNRYALKLFFSCSFISPTSCPLLDSPDGRISSFDQASKPAEAQAPLMQLTLFAQ